MRAPDEITVDRELLAQAIILLNKHGCSIVANALNAVYVAQMSPSNVGNETPTP